MKSSGVHCAVCCALIAAGPLVVGCGRPAEVAPVAGLVTIGGQPAEQILVTFVPSVDEGMQQIKSSAVTDSKGQFQLRAEDGRDGAVLGNHRVVFEDLRLYYLPRDESAVKSRTTSASRVGRIYRAASSTPVKFQVRAGEQATTFELPP